MYVDRKLKRISSSSHKTINRQTTVSIFRTGQKNELTVISFLLLVYWALHNLVISKISTIPSLLFSSLPLSPICFNLPLLTLVSDDSYCCYLSLLLPGLNLFVVVFVCPVTHGAAFGMRSRPQAITLPISSQTGRMSDKNTAENLLNSLVDTFVEKQKSIPFFEEEKAGSVSSQINKLFGRQKPVHHLLGGGKSADVLLWRNKKISASVLTGATAVWVLFEWLNYHFLTLVCFILVLGMLAQFLWSNASGLVNSTPSKVPRVVLPEELFVNIATVVGEEVNRGLRFLQDVACGGNLKQFLIVVASLFAGAVIGSWCNFLTVIYIGFVAAHTLPVLYEKHEDEVDNFVYKVLGQVQNHYRNLDASVLSKIPKGKFKGKKHE
ncbi:hypothetical protein VNO77_42854 [Canavalia gladiata]|uniref:Reticulon-like protein n=1 Tax=Canavalia gladiata TaxID=3824 RepID=A0AAN9JTR5_CANGL